MSRRDSEHLAPKHRAPGKRILARGGHVIQSETLYQVGHTVLAWTQYPSYRTSVSTRPLSPVGLGARTQNPMDAERNPETVSSSYLRLQFPCDFEQVTCLG